MSVSVFIFLLACAYAHGIQVNTTEGIVKGFNATDGDYYTFQGIPYAGPTEGIHRFKAPTAPAPHPKVFSANINNITCAQPSERGIVGIENCLVLSIFAKKNLTNLKPVMVWLNAEEYTTTNTETFSPKTFVEENIVFVKLNFRLSVFGFLCLGVPEAPGNAGLRDVLQGLKWIASNIAKFGGNPNNIILIGHASGAAMVDLITMMPQAKDLVHKAIALSGSGLAPWAVAYDPLGAAEFLLAKLKHANATPAQIKVELAKNLTKTDLSTITSALAEALHFKNNTPLFAPCIENENLNPNDTLLSDAPINILRSGKQLQIPYLAGYTTKEGTIRANDAIYRKWLDVMNANFSDFLPVDLTRNISSKDQLNDLAYFIKQIYFDFHSVNMSTIDRYLDYIGDTLVVVPMLRAARERISNSSQSVRLLEFGHLGTTESNVINNQTVINGVPHGRIINYLFNYHLNAVDEAASKSLVKRLVTFAYTGTPHGTNSSIDIPWPVVTKDNLNLLHYSGSQVSNLTEIVISNPRRSRIMFLEGFYDMHYAAPTSAFTDNTPLLDNPHAPGNSNNILSSIIFVMFCQLIVRLV